MAESLIDGTLLKHKQGLSPTAVMEIMRCNLIFTETSVAGGGPNDKGTFYVFFKLQWCC